MKEYVLVVDDEQSLRQVLELFFKKEGFEVDTASSLAEAEAAIASNAYDLVLTDLRMTHPDDGLKSSVSSSAGVPGGNSKGRASVSRSVFSASGCAANASNARASMRTGAPS